MLKIFGFVRISSGTTEVNTGLSQKVRISVGCTYLREVGELPNYVDNDIKFFSGEGNSQYELHFSNALHAMFDAIKCTDKDDHVIVVMKSITRIGVEYTSIKHVTDCLMSFHNDVSHGTSACAHKRICYQLAVSVKQTGISVYYIYVRTYDLLLKRP